MKNLCLLFNPFVKLNEKIALILGIAGIFATAFLSWKVNGIYSDFINFSGSRGVLLEINLVMQFAISAFSVLFFYIAALLFSHSKPRFIDVAGYVLFAQLPLMLTPLFYLPHASQVLLNPPLPIDYEWIMRHWNFKSATLMCLSVVPLVWSWILLFNALKVSANLKGWRLWIAFISVFLGLVLFMRLLVFNFIIREDFYFLPSSLRQIIVVTPTEKSTKPTNLGIWASTLGEYEATLLADGKSEKISISIVNDGKLSVKARFLSTPSKIFPVENFNISTTIKGALISFDIPEKKSHFEGYFTASDGRRFIGILESPTGKSELAFEKNKLLQYQKSVRIKFCDGFDFKRLESEMHFANSEIYLLAAENLPSEIKSMYTNKDDMAFSIWESVGLSVDENSMEKQANLSVSHNFMGICNIYTKALADAIAKISGFWEREKTDANIKALREKLKKENIIAKRKSIMDSIFNICSSGEIKSQVKDVLYGKINLHLFDLNVPDILAQNYLSQFNLQSDKDFIKLIGTVEDINYNDGLIHATSKFEVIFSLKDGKAILSYSPRQIPYKKNATDNSWSYQEDNVNFVYGQYNYKNREGYTVSFYDSFWYKFFPKFIIFPDTGPIDKIQTLSKTLTCPPPYPPVIFIRTNDKYILRTTDLSKCNLSFVYPKCSYISLRIDSIKNIRIDNTNVTKEKLFDALSEMAKTNKELPEVFVDARKDIPKEYIAEIFDVLKKCGFKKIRRGVRLPILEKILLNSGNVLEEFEYSEEIEISGSNIIIPRILRYSIYSPLSHSTCVVSLESAKILKNFDFNKYIQ